MSRADLRLALRRGWLLLSAPGLGGVEVFGTMRGVIRYDSTLPAAERAPLMLALMRDHEPPAEQVEAMRQLRERQSA